MIKQGRYFFAENDFMPEITSVDVFGQKGTFSAGLSIFDNPSSNDFLLKIVLELINMPWYRYFMK